MNREVILHRLNTENVIKYQSNIHWISINRYLAQNPFVVRFELDSNSIRRFGPVLDICLLCFSLHRTSSTNILSAILWSYTVIFSVELMQLKIFVKKIFLLFIYCSISLLSISTFAMACCVYISLGVNC